MQTVGDARRALTLAAISMSWFTACAKPPPPSQPPAHAQAPAPIYEEEIKPIGKLEMQIVEMNETPSPDRRTVTVTGTLINRGTRATREVWVHVEALDKDGAVVVSADSEPSTETIPAGGTGTFSVRFENRSNVDRYHVEAIAR